MVKQKSSDVDIVLQKFCATPGLLKNGKGISKFCLSKVLSKKITFTCGEKTTFTCGGRARSHMK